MQQEPETNTENLCSLLKNCNFTFLYFFSSSNLIFLISSLLQKVITFLAVYTLNFGALKTVVVVVFEEGNMDLKLCSFFFFFFFLVIYKWQKEKSKSFIHPFFLVFFCPKL